MEDRVSCMKGGCRNESHPGALSDRRFSCLLLTYVLLLLYINHGLELLQRAFRPIITIENLHLQTFLHSLEITFLFIKIIFLIAKINDVHIHRYWVGAHRKHSRPNYGRVTYKNIFSMNIIKKPISIVQKWHLFASFPVNHMFVAISISYFGRI